MPPRRLLLDSDIFVLLAGTGLMADLISAAGSVVQNTRRLQPLPHMLRKGGLVRRYPEGVRQKARAWCSTIASVERAPSPTLIGRLLQVPEVDPGEALLLAVAAETEDALVATGDRRACAALGRARDLDDVRALLARKIICLETALGLLLKGMGYTSLVRALTPVREHNQTLRVLLPQGELTAETTFRDGLSSYLRALCSETGELLFDDSEESGP